MRYFALLLLCLCFADCGASSRTVSQSTPAHCQVRNGLPDLSCSPSAIFANATTAQICTPGYSRSVRNVPQSEKNKVYAEYGIASHMPGQYEIDHSISLELGGSNDIKNLWPEAYTGTYNAHDKDKVENYLHSEVCSGKMPLHDAQVAIATNWKQYLNRKVD